LKKRQGYDHKVNDVSTRVRKELAKRQAEYLKALAHPLRIAIVESLRPGELTVNQVTQKLNIEQANASQQLAVLRHANIIASRKEGNQVFYSIHDDAVFNILEGATQMLLRELQNVGHILEGM
jgi:ArsR family transcriptional regulator